MSDHQKMEESLVLDLKSSEFYLKKNKKNGSSLVVLCPQMQIWLCGAKPLII